MHVLRLVAPDIVRADEEDLLVNGPLDDDLVRDDLRGHVNDRPANLLDLDRRDGQGDEVLVQRLGDAFADHFLEQEERAGAGQRPDLHLLDDLGEDVDDDLLDQGGAFRVEMEEDRRHRGLDDRVHAGRRARDIEHGIEGHVLRQMVRPSGRSGQRRSAGAPGLGRSPCWESHGT